jgi:hypothetical protein
MIEYNLTPTKSYDTIKLGIAAHASGAAAGRGDRVVSRDTITTECADFQIAWRRGGEREF